MWSAFMDDLRSHHLGAQAVGRSVFAELQAACEAVVERNAFRRQSL
jgi:hypothetical protein